MEAWHPRWWLGLREKRWFTNKAGPAFGLEATGVRLSILWRCSRRERLGVGRGCGIG